MPRWTPEEKMLLAAFYPHSHPQALARLFAGKRITESINCHSAKKVMGLRKTAAYIYYWNRERKGYPAEGTIKKDPNGYALIFSGNKWRRLAHVIWERHHGPIPENHMITYLDGNRDNTDITNLVLMTRRDSLKKNSFTNYPKELRQIIKLNNQLNREIGHEKPE